MKKWLVHALFHCEDCSKEWGWYRTAQRLAREHAMKQGHSVRGETGYAVTYLQIEEETKP